MHDLGTTLVAIATPPGRGGLGCVRLSGPDAFTIAPAIVRSGRTIALPGTGAPLFVAFADAAGALLDHGFLVAFEANRAFTGEASIELWTHGSPPVLAALVEAAVANGARPAGPGEFTYRALRNGRLDLAQAEAVRDLIAARTKHQARVAFLQVEGALARRLAPLEEILLDLCARGEAAVEFVEEADVHTPAGFLRDGIERALALARELAAEGRRGHVLREGARVALCGATSVGKSSLFNRLLARDRAIVSPVPGTTRDTLEDTVDLDGTPVTLIDTAGLRESANEIEAEGVRRARRAAGEADLVLLVFDATRPPEADERAAQETAARTGGASAIVVVNKIDLAPADGTAPGAIGVSALTGRGLDDLRGAVLRALGAAGPAENPVLTDARQTAALSEAIDALEGARRAIVSGLSEEAALLDLRQALSRLGEITGEVASDDLYDRIFSTFCIGK
jgi:tRNA modification GTPase